MTDIRSMDAGSGILFCVNFAIRDTQNANSIDENIDVVYIKYGGEEN